MISRAAGRRFDAAIIDLDGTMVDTLDDFVAALGATLDDLGLAVVSRAFIERTIGKGSEHLIRSTLAEVGADPARYQHAWACYQQRYREVNGSYASVYPGVVEGLEHLAARGLALACVTNKPEAFAIALLQRTQLATHFAWVAGGDRFALRKPDPLPFVETCKALGSEPSRTLVIGDSANDAIAARAAGCPVLLVRYGYNHGEPVEAVDADGVIDRLDQIGPEVFRPRAG